MRKFTIMIWRVFLFITVLSANLNAQVADSIGLRAVDSLVSPAIDSVSTGILPDISSDSSIFGAGDTTIVSVLDSMAMDSVVPFLNVPTGFYLDFGLGWDTVSDLLDQYESNLLWYESSEDWSWTQRQNSSLGGLIYNPLEPWMEAQSNGMVEWLSRKQELPELSLASAPRFKLYGRSGLGGGQQFGMETQTPMDSMRQLYLNYERTNALGFYRNEGSDGHELSLAMRSRVPLDSSFRQWTESLEIRYYSMITGQNGGLSQVDLFQTNVPSLRRNFAVEHSAGAYREDFLDVDYSRRFGVLQYGGSMSWNQWSAENDWSTTEYYWDSTDTDVQLLSRNLSYDDTVSVLGVFGHLGGHYDDRGWTVDFNVKGGLERLSSDVLGWDGIRLDSSASFVSFSSTWSPVIRGSLHVQKLWKGWFLNGQYKMNALGYNYGSLNASTVLSKEVSAGSLSAGWRFLNQSQMYRWENVYGYSYDFRSVSTPYVRNTLFTSFKRGDKWRLELDAKGHQLYGLRYLVDTDSLGLYNGVLATGQVSLQSDRQGWNLGLKMYGNYRSGEGGFSVPSWGTRVNGFYQTSIGDRFQLRTGMDCSVEDSFYAPTYGGTLPLWSMQSDVLAASYPWSSIYFEARIGNFIGGARILNVLEGLAPYSYFAYGATPRTDRWIQLSARWTLFN